MIVTPSNAQNIAPLVVKPSTSDLRLVIRSRIDPCHVMVGRALGIRKAPPALPAKITRAIIQGWRSAPTILRPPLCSNPNMKLSKIVIQSAKSSTPAASLEGLSPLALALPPPAPPAGPRSWTSGAAPPRSALLRALPLATPSNGELDETNNENMEIEKKNGHD